MLMPIYHGSLENIMMRIKFNGDFIAGINVSNGVITFHLNMKYWVDVLVEEADHSIKYDSYTSEDIKGRIKSLKKIKKDVIHIIIRVKRFLLFFFIFIIPYSF